MYMYLIYKTNHILFLKNFKSIQFDVPTHFISHIIYFIIEPIIKLMMILNALFTNM